MTGGSVRRIARIEDRGEGGGAPPRERGAPLTTPLRPCLASPLHCIARAHRIRAAVSAAYLSSHYPILSYPSLTQAYPPIQPTQPRPTASFVCFCSFAFAPRRPPTPSFSDFSLLYLFDSVPISSTSTAPAKSPHTPGQLRPDQLGPPSSRLSSSPAPATPVTPATPPGTRTSLSRFFSRHPPSLLNTPSAYTDCIDTSARQVGQPC